MAIADIEECKRGTFVMPTLIELESFDDDGGHAVFELADADGGHHDHMVNEDSGEVIEFFATARSC